MEKTFFRIHHPDNLGLWYNKDGVFTRELDKYSLSCANLEMDKNDDCAGGFLSCTDTLDNLFNWFTREEIQRLEEAGYRACVFKAQEHKFHDKYKHFLFKEEGSILVAQIKLI